MSFRIELDKYDEAYGHFMREIRSAIQATFAQEAERRNLTQADLAQELNVNPSVVSRRLSGSGNVTLRTICDLYTAMDREPLSNFLVRGIWAPHHSENWSMNISNNGDQVVVVANSINDRPDVGFVENFAVWQVKTNHGALHSTFEVPQNSFNVPVKANSQFDHPTALFYQELDHA